jgi:hypothetical protein
MLGKNSLSVSEVLVSKECLQQTNRQVITSNFVICSLFATTDVDETEERFVKGEGSSKGCHLIGVLEDARASQLMREAFHVVEYLNHDIVAGRVAIRVALGNMLSDLVVKLLGSVGAAISASFVEIIMELEGQKNTMIVG